MFVTSRFIDGDFWFWWDRIEYVFDRTRKDHASLPVGNGPTRFLTWGSEREKDAVREVVEGLRAIERNTGIKPTTFAYPNGRACDFSNDVVEVLKREGVVGAVTGEWGVVSKGQLAALSDPLYRLPRVGVPTTVDGFLQAIRGGEALKQALGYE